MDLEVLWKSEIFCFFFSYFLYLTCLKVGLDARRDNLNEMKGGNKIASDESFLCAFFFFVHLVVVWRECLLDCCILVLTLSMDSRVNFSFVFHVELSVSFSSLIFQ